MTQTSIPMPEPPAKQRLLVATNKDGEPLMHCPRCKRPSTEFDTRTVAVRKTARIWDVNRISCPCGHIISEETLGTRPMPPGERTDDEKRKNRV